VQLDDLLLIQLADRQSAGSAADEQAVGDEALERIPRRRPADSQAGGDRLLADGVAGTQGALEDQAAQRLVRRLDVRAARIAPTKVSAPALACRPPRSTCSSARSGLRCDAPAVREASVFRP
jgi:hypothetical protein